jgi:hypothetical protein
MKKLGLYIFATTVMLISMASCGSRHDDMVPSPAPAVYYWKTVFKLDGIQQQFLRRHAIKKIYLRFFDVDFNEQRVPIPMGTVQFDSKVPSGIEIIPVVYIENHCLERPHDLAQNIVKRVLTMASTNNINIKELQIDCDWNNRSRRTYFELLHDIKSQLDRRGHFLLSATIRLHQLSQPVPPVDYGVLMCYNTGNIHDYNTANAILDAKEVRPFINKRLADYRLPLCAAYPAFGWKLLFEKGQFRTILREIDLTDSTLYRRISDKKYIVLRSHSVAVPDPNSFGLMVRAGDEIKIDEVSANTLFKVKSMLEAKRPNINRQVIIFSLNSINTNKLSAYEMDKIYRH